MPKRNYPDNMIRGAEYLYSNGVKISQIVKELGVPRGTVTYWVKREHIQRLHRGYSALKRVETPSSIKCHLILALGAVLVITLALVGYYTKFIR